MKTCPSCKHRFIPSFNARCPKCCHNLSPGTACSAESGSLSSDWVVDAKAEIKRRKKLAKMHDSNGNYRGADYHFAYIAGIRFAIKAERKRSTTESSSAAKLGGKGQP
jgi:hypothetical protein